MLPSRRNPFDISNFFGDSVSDLMEWANDNFSETRTTIPSVNVKENADEYVVEVAAPGMKKEDFNIELNNNILTIKSEVKNENEENNERYTRREFSYQSFQRTFNLNNRVIDENNIQAKYENGILKLHLAKKEEAKEKPARLIEIS